MLPRPSLSSLVHELFDGEWPADDPQFREEVERYGAIIRRMLATDSQLSHFIRMQPILDNDQIASVPIVTGVMKVKISASCESSGGQFVLNMSSSPVALGQMFSSIVLDAGDGSKSCRVGDGEKVTETFAAQQSRVCVTATWNLDIVQVSPAMYKFLGVVQATRSEIAQRLLAHIDARNLCTNDEVRCDTTLRHFVDSDRFALADLATIVDQNTRPVDPLKITLDLPNGSKISHVTIPCIYGMDGEFKPLKVPPPPIREFLEAAIDSKEHLKALLSFEKDPEGFMEHTVIEEGRMKCPDEFLDSSYFFGQPWVAETASDMIKAYECVKKRKDKP